MLLRCEVIVGKHADGVKKSVRGYANEQATAPVVDYNEHKARCGGIDHLQKIG